LNQNRGRSFKAGATIGKGNIHFGDVDVPEMAARFQELINSRAEEISAGRIGKVR